MKTNQPIWKEISKFILLPSVLSFCAIAGVHAANFSSVQSGAWNDPATWGAASFPMSGDNVGINNTHTVTVSGNQAASSLGVNSGGTLSINGASMLTISSNFTGEGGSAVSGAGTFQTNGTVSMTVKGDFGAVFSALLLVNSGTTTTNAWGNGVGFSPTSFGGPITITHGATLLTDWTVTSGAVTVNGTLGGTGGQRFDFNGATFINNGTVSNNDFRFGRNGVQNVSGAGTWSGGGISIVSSAIVTPTTTVTFGASSMVVGNLGTAGSLALNGQTVIINRPGSSANFSVEGGGAVSGAGTFQTDGTVSLTSKGDFGAVFSGALLINSGTTTANAWGNNVGFSPSSFSGSIMISNGATLLTDWTVTSGPVTVNGTLGGTGSNRFDFNGPAFVTNGTVSNNDFRFGGNGIQNVSGAGTWSGGGISIVSGAILTPTSNVTFGPSSMVVGNLGTAGTIALNGQTVIINRLGSTANVSVEGGGTVSGLGTFQTDGTVSITQKGTFSSALVVNGGITSAAQWGNGVGFSPSSFDGPITIANGATLTAVGSDAGVVGSGDVTVNGAFGGDKFVFSGETLTNNGTVSLGNFAFDRNGTQAISGSGVMIVAAVSVSASSDVVNGARHTLMGNGTIGIASGGSLANDGFIAPGLSPGQLTVNGSLPLNFPSKLVFEIGGTGQGTTYDLLDKTDGGTLTLNGKLTLSLVNAFTPQQSDTFTIVTTQTILGGAFTNVKNGGRLNTTDGSGSFEVTYNVPNNAALSQDVILSNFGPPLGPSQLLNISTRMRVLTGDNVLIGGFIVTGTDAKKVIVRGLGPSLTSQGVPGALQDTTLELHDGTGATIASNDNWKDTQQAEIQATGIPPSNDLESAIVATLPANNSAYTAILRGKNGTTGVGLVEVYDLDQSANSRLANISTRGFVDTGDNVMIGGIIVGPSTANATTVLVRAIGPSLSSLGVPNALQDPMLELHDGNGNLFASNDNWKDTQQADIEATTIPPTDDAESAILVTVAPGNYTAIVRGAGNTTGVGLVEVYNLQ